MAMKILHSRLYQKHLEEERAKKDAINKSKIVALENGININIVTAPYFLATKFEAFKNRGNNDYLVSHDLGFEDQIHVDQCLAKIELPRAILSYEVKTAWRFLLVNQHG